MRVINLKECIGCFFKVNRLVVVGFWDYIGVRLGGVFIRWVRCLVYGFVFDYLMFLCWCYVFF